MIFFNANRIALCSPKTTKHIKSIVEMQYNALDSPNSFVPSTMPQKFYSEDYNMVCMGHRGFTVKITDSPNIGTVIMPWRIYSIEY